MPKARPHLLTLSLLAGTYILAQAIVVPSFLSFKYNLKQITRPYNIPSPGIFRRCVCELYCRATIGSFWKTSNNAAIFFHFFDLSLGCYISEDLYSFLFFRLCQSSSAAGLVLSRAIIGDFSSKDETVKMLGLLSISMGIAPSLAPLAGGVISDFLVQKEYSSFLLSSVFYFSH